MGWNEPGRDRDPWEGGGDVDEFLSRLKHRLARRFGRGLPGQRPRGPRLWWVGPLTLVAVWLLTGFYDVPAGSRAVLLQFGAYSGVSDAGLHWHWPWPVTVAHLVNVAEQRSVSRRQTVMTADGQLASVELTVNYRVGDPYAYLFAASAPTNVLSVLAGSALTTAVRSHTLQALRDGSAAVASDLDKRLARQLDDLKLGMKISSVHFSRVAMPDAVTEAQSQIERKRKQEAAAAASARAAAQAELEHAQARAHKIVAAAQSAGAARVAQAHADVARFQALVPAWRRSPLETEQMLRSEAVREVLASAPKIIVSGPVRVVSIPAWSETASRPVRARGAATARAPAAASGAKRGGR